MTLNDNQNKCTSKQQYYYESTSLKYELKLNLDLLLIWWQAYEIFTAFVVPLVLRAINHKNTQLSTAANKKDVASRFATE